jgi:hypothetical protein
MVPAMKASKPKPNHSKTRLFVLRAYSLEGFFTSVNEE